MAKHGIFPGQRDRPVVAQVLCPVKDRWKGSAFVVMTGFCFNAVN